MKNENNESLKKDQNTKRNRSELGGLKTDKKIFGRKEIVKENTESEKTGRNTKNYTIMFNQIIFIEEAKKAEWC